jgi:hypothetical protein
LCDRCSVLSGAAADDDDVFQAFVGRQVTVPMSGGRTIPVIADDYVDMEFGTGALKITPGGALILRRSPPGHLLRHWGCTG